MKGQIIYEYSVLIGQKVWDSIELLGSRQIMGFSKHNNYMLDLTVYSPSHLYDYMKMGT